jgi:ActR/RegA family two-component response regulator
MDSGHWRARADVEVVMMTAFATVETAVEAVSRRPTSPNPSPTSTR